jgi:hypothetical protein
MLGAAPALPGSAGLLGLAHLALCQVWDRGRSGASARIHRSRITDARGVTATQDRSMRSTAATDARSLRPDAWSSHDTAGTPPTVGRTAWL